MIIKIEQVQSNFKNSFEIRVNNELKYLAGTPWMNIDLPLNAENTRPYIMTDINENICYTSSYNIIENVSNSAIPMKWAFSGEQKKYIFNVYNKENTICGKFYKLTNGILDTKYVIEYNNYILKCYDISVGKTRNISIYNEEHQIAEIIKPLHNSNNLDYYYLFLLDQYSNLEEILSFFTIFFDYKNYSHNGDVTGYKEEVNVEYTYDKNNKFYDKNWITNHFKKEDIDIINNKMLEDRKATTNSIKKHAKYIIPFIVLGWIIVFIILGILIL